MGDLRVQLGRSHNQPKRNLASCSHWEHNAWRRRKDGKTMLKSGFPNHLTQLARADYTFDKPKAAKGVTLCH